MWRLERQPTFAVAHLFTAAASSIAERMCPVCLLPFVTDADGTKTNFQQGRQVAQENDAKGAEPNKPSHILSYLPACKDAFKLQPQWSFAASLAAIRARWHALHTPQLQIVGPTASLGPRLPRLTMCSAFSRHRWLQCGSVGEPPDIRCLVRAGRGAGAGTCAAVATPLHAASSVLLPDPPPPNAERAGHVEPCRAAFLPLGLAVCQALMC